MINNGIWGTRPSSQSWAHLHVNPLYVYVVWIPEQIAVQLTCRK